METLLREVRRVTGLLMLMARAFDSKV